MNACDESECVARGKDVVRVGVSSFSEECSQNPHCRTIRSLYPRRLCAPAFVVASLSVWIWQLNGSAFVRPSEGGTNDESSTTISKQFFCRTHIHNPKKAFSPTSHEIPLLPIIPSGGRLCTGSQAFSDEKPGSLSRNQRQRNGTCLDY